MQRRSAVAGIGGEPPAGGRLRRSRPGRLRADEPRRVPGADGQAGVHRPDADALGRRRIGVRLRQRPDTALSGAESPAAFDRMLAGSASRTCRGPRSTGLGDGAFALFFDPEDNTRTTALPWSSARARRRSRSWSMPTKGSRPKRRCRRPWRSPRPSRPSCRRVNLSRCHDNHTYRFHTSFHTVSIHEKTAVNLWLHPAFHHARGRPADFCPLRQIQEKHRTCQRTPRPRNDAVPAGAGLAERAGGD